MSTPLTFQSLTAGEYHTCGLSGGAAYCWGANWDGQYGDGTTSQSSVPVVAGGGVASYATINAGQYFTCGTTAGGTGYCWGANTYGQLGAGTLTEEILSPSVVPGAWAYIAGGENHSCGVSTSGAAYCWGDNIYGELGNSDLNTMLLPVPVTGGLVVMAPVFMTSPPTTPPSKTGPSGTR